MASRGARRSGRSPAVRRANGGGDSGAARDRDQLRGKSSRAAPEGGFRLISGFEPKGDQPRAIAELVAGIERGDKHQVLLGVTGSGKTFTMANVIARVQKPTLIIAHNKTLAAQLYGEFKELFPENAVEYFVSYYDYYQPEAYVPASDTYIEKDAIINDEIDRMRHAATHALLTRRDVIIVASVSCIYGIGSAEAYYGMLVSLDEGDEVRRDAVLRKLVAIQYERNDVDFHRGTFRVRGDVVEVFPAYEESVAIRIEWFGDTVESIAEIDPLRGKVLRKLPRVAIFPGSHYVTPADKLALAISAIKEELHEQLAKLKAEMRLVEAQRLEQRTMFDLEMLEQMGYCTGIENYSRHLSGRSEGQPPPTLIDYFPHDYLLIIDESHATIPQLQAMYRGDRSRKETLVEFGFRLRSALDNRPLKFEEFEERVTQAVYVSATPGDYELEKSGGVVVEQIIRPTGLMDPAIEVRPVASQVDDLLEEIRQRVARNERVLVTTLTKRMAEDLTEYYRDLGVRVRYLHSDVETLERIAIIRDLRKGEFDVLVGINLLREGLDLPEVSLVAILDADKEGFLRAERSLIQTCGRAARNVNGKVIMYADKITPSMKVAIDETERRRRIQDAYNKEHGITPKTVVRSILDMETGRAEQAAAAGAAGAGRPAPAGASRYELGLADFVDVAALPRATEGETLYNQLSGDGGKPDLKKLTRLMEKVRRQMLAAAGDLEFEKAAALRDQLKALEELELALR